MNIKSDLKGIHAQDRKILRGLVLFVLFICIVISASISKNTADTNTKLRRQISYLQHEIEVLRATVKTDVIDREGQLPYNQVAGHLKALGL